MGNETRRVSQCHILYGLLIGNHVRWIQYIIIGLRFHCLAALSFRFFADTIRYDTIAEFNVDSKAENSALSSTNRELGLYQMINS